MSARSASLQQSSTTMTGKCSGQSERLMQTREVSSVLTAWAHSQGWKDERCRCHMRVRVPQDQAVRSSQHLSKPQTYILSRIVTKPDGHQTLQVQHAGEWVCLWSESRVGRVPAMLSRYFVEANCRGVLPLRKGTLTSPKPSTSTNARA